MNSILKRVSVLLAMTFVAVIINAQSIQNQTIFVKSVSEVEAKISDLQPGDQMILEDGVYEGIQLIVKNSGTEQRKIVIEARNPGKVFFTGDVRVELRGQHLVLSGIYFKDGDRNVKEWKSHGPGLVAIYNSYNRVTECAFDAFDEVDSAYITTSLDEHGNVPTHCRIDHCSFTNKTTYDQVINLNNTPKKTLDGPVGVPMYHVVEYCYFSNPKKKGNAGGGIRVGYWRKDLGRCLIQHNVFDRQDSEPEIITSKSQENVYYNNTFKNCQGTLNFRHGDAQVAVNNFFVTTDDLYQYGGIFVWGSRHLIASNSFQLNTTIKSRGNAAVYLNSGIPGDEHALAFDIDMYNNVFEDVNGSFIDFQGLKERRIARCEELGKPFELAHDIRLNGNVFLKSSSAYPEFVIDKGNKTISWETNYASKKNKKYGFKKLESAENFEGCFQTLEKKYGIENIDLNLNEIASAGPTGQPKNFEDVGPSWLKENPSSFAVTGKLPQELKERLKRNKNRR